MSEEAHAARDLAEAIEHLETLRLFDMNVQGCEMRLTWSNGSALGGYSELSQAISEIVSEGWYALKLEAIRRAEWRVDQARQKLRSALTVSGGA